MDAISEQVRELAKDADASQRIQILDHLRGLARSLESTPDTMQRLSYMVSVHGHNILEETMTDLGYTSTWSLL